MAVALVRQAVNAASAPVGNNGSVTITASAAGNLLVLSVHLQSTTETVTAVTDNVGNTWVKAVQVFGSASQEIWYAANCAAGATTVTIAMTLGKAYSANVSEWSGVATSSALRATNTAVGTTSPNHTGTVTPVVGDLVLGGFSANSATARTLSAAGYTALTNGTQPAGFSGAEAYIVATTTAATEATWTTASATNTGGAIAAFAVAGGAAVLPRSTSDAVTTTDSAAATVALTRSATDAVTTTDATSRTIRATRGATDTVATTDAAVRTSVAPRTTADTLTTSDTAARVTIATRSGADTLTVVDAAASAFARTRAAADTITTTDAVAGTLTLARAPVDVIVAADVPVRATAMPRAIGDAASLTDHASATVIPAGSTVPARGQVMVMTTSSVRPLPVGAVTIGSTSRGVSRP